MLNKIKMLFRLPQLRFLPLTMCLLLGISTIGWAKDFKTPIFPASLDPSVGIDSPAIKTGNLVFISGLGTGSIKNSRNISAQIEEAFKRLRIVANAAGGNLDDIVKINVYLLENNFLP